MGWITFMAVSIFILVLFALMTARSMGSRRSGRLEAAFLRARGSRMVSNGFVPGRF